MLVQRLLTALLVLCRGVAGATQVSHNRQPLLIRIPLPREGRQLRGLPAGLDSPLAFGAIPAGAIPLGAIPLGAIPSGAIPLDLTEDFEEAPPPVVAMDGPLRDLLDFGSAFGAAVAPKRLGFEARGALGGPLELPVDALHVKMQRSVPAPLKIDDSPSRVRIYGTLPTNLTAKTLKVSFSGRDRQDLLVQYFLGQAASKQVVGIDEHFDLDFIPVESPTVKYKAATGSFELTLPRPAAAAKKEVDIDFDTTSVLAPRAEAPRAAAKVALERAARPASKRGRGPARVAAGAVAHTAVLARRPASEAMPVAAKASKQNAESLAKVTKQLREVAESRGPTADRKESAGRAREIVDKAKQFVAEAQLGDVRKGLAEAFAPLDTTDGMVLLEISH